MEPSIGVRIPAPQLLGSAFIAEGIWTYPHELPGDATAALRPGIGSRWCSRDALARRIGDRGAGSR